MSETIEIQVICDFEPVTIQVFEAGEGVSDHEPLTGRDKDNQHPGTAISIQGTEFDDVQELAEYVEDSEALTFDNDTIVGEGTGVDPLRVDDKVQKAIAGIVDFDLTAEAGDTHTITILPEHSGKALDIRANLDDEVTIIVGNDTVIEQPITLRLTGVFTRELRAANTDILIEANDVLDDGGIDYVDITGETINTVQIIRKSNNLIWVI